MNLFKHGLNKNKKETSKKKTKKSKEKTLTVQDLITYDEITEKGIIRIGETFNLVMETDQANSSLLDFDENAALWSNFRTMLNSINVRHSMILQSHFFDVNDFVNNYNVAADNLTNLTPQLITAKEDVIKGYRKFTEERNRDQRSYIIYRYNPDLEGIEVNFETGNALIDDLFRKAKSKTSDSDDEESRSIAFSVLEEVADLTYQLLHRMGIRSVRLNRIGVLNMIYSTLNRDLTTSQRLLDASESHSFAEIKVSETPHLYKDLLSSSDSDEIELFESYNQWNLLKEDMPDSSVNIEDKEVPV